MKMFFVSSTFKDMHFERDMIHEIVSPQINEYAVQFGDSVSFCDLRWGVNTGNLESEEGSKKVLRVCLDEIDKCRPYMVIIIGERYGWIPQKDLISEAVGHRQDFALEELEMSVTALEIEYGALCHPDKIKNTLIYFREFEGDIPENYQIEGEAHGKKLRELKDRVNKITGGNVRTYKVRWDEETQSLVGVDHFAQMLVHDVKELLEQDWKEYQLLNPYEKDQRIQWEYALQKTQQFSGRSSYIARFKEKLESGQELLIIKGASGSGKSTLVSQLAKELKDRYEICLLFSGNTIMSNNTLNVLKSMVYFVEEKLQVPHFEDSLSSNGEEENEKVADLVWVDRLTEIITDYESKCEKKLLFVLDAIDQLADDELREKRYYIPACLSEKVQMVVSCLDDYFLPYEDAERVLPLTDDDKYEIIKGIASYLGRELESCVIEKMIQKKSSDTPLYLSMMIQRLVMMNKSDFDDIVAHGDGMAEITKHQMHLVDTISDSLQGIGVDILKAASERVGGAFAEKAAMYIALSRYGLRESDLEKIMSFDGLDWNTLDFSIFVKYMRSLFIMREDGRIDFAHKSIRQGYQNICENQKEMHKQILESLKVLDEKEPIRLHEIMYHCIKADDKQYFTEYVENYNKDAVVMESMAEVVKLLTLEDEGEWLLQTMKTEKTQKAHIAMLNFLNFELDDAYDVVQKELEIELKLYQHMVNIAMWLYEMNADDKSIRRLALVYRNMANLYDLQDDKISRNIARDYYEKTLELRKVLIENDSVTLADRRQLAIAYDSLADSYTYEEDHISLKTGYQYYEESYKIRKKLLEEEPSVKHRAYVAKSLKKLGKVHSYFNTNADDDQALNYFEKAEAIYAQLVQDDDSFRKNLSDIYHEKGKIYENKNTKEDLEQALSCYKQNLQIRERINIENGNSLSRKKLALAYLDVAKFYMEHGVSEDIKLAEALYKKALDMRLQIYKERKTAQSHYELSRVYYLLGECYMAMGEEYNRSKAREMFQKTLDIREELAKTQKTDDSIMYLIAARRKMAFLLMETGKVKDKDEALSLMRKNIEDRERFVELHKTRKSEIALATEYLNYSRIGFAHNVSIDELEEILQKAISIYTKYEDEDMVYSDMHNVSLCCQDLVNIYLSYGTEEHTKKALYYAEKSNRICEKMMEKSPILECAELLASSYEKSGYVYRNMDNVIKAESVMRDAIRIQEEVLKKSSSAFQQKNLMIYYHDYCNFLWDSKDMQIRENVNQIMEKLIPFAEELENMYGTVELQRRLMKIYLRKWTIEGNKGSYDDKVAAVLWIQKAESLFKKIEGLTEDKESIEHLKYELNWAYGDYYFICEGKENYEKSIAYYKLCESYVRNTQDEHTQFRLASFARVLFRGYEKLGAIHYDLLTEEDNEIAREYYLQALTIWKEIQNSVSELNYYRNVANVTKWLGNTCFYQNDTSKKMDSIQYYQMSVDAAQKLVKLETNELWIKCLAEAYERLGTAYEKVNVTDGKLIAREQFILAEEWFDKLTVESYLKEVAARRSVNLFKIAAGYLGLGTAEDALQAKAAFEKGIQTYDTFKDGIMEEDVQYNIAAARLQLGSLYCQGSEDDKKNAIGILEESVDLLKDLCQKNKKAMYQDNLWMGMYLLARNDFYEKSKHELVSEMLPIAEDLCENVGGERYAGFLDFCQYVLKID